MKKMHDKRGIGLSNPFSYIERDWKKKSFFRQKNAPWMAACFASILTDI